MKEFYGRGSPRKRGFRRSTLLRLAGFFRSLRLAQVARSGVFWDRIIAIEPRGLQDTYDLTVEHDHNFVANGLVVHNSHSAAYAMVAYECAWLKAHHPAEFMAATMTSEMSDSSRIVTLIAECRRMGLEILPPDVNRSEWKFSLEDGRIRVGLGAVRNVGQAAVEGLIAARRAPADAVAETAPTGCGGASGTDAAGALTGAPAGEATAAAAGSGVDVPFRDLFDLARRVDTRSLNRRVLESLVAAGACDGFGEDRGRMYAGAGKVLEQAAALHRDLQRGQSSLFGEDGSGEVVVAAPPLPPGEPWTSRDRSAKEKEVLGFYFTEHPLEPLRGELDRLTTHAITDLPHLPHGTDVRVAGLIGEVRTINTRAGKLMAAVVLEDLTGRIEGTMFPDVYEGARAWLVADEIVVAVGRIETRDERGAKLLLSDVRRLEEARAAWAPCLHVEVRAEQLSVEWLEQVDELLSAYPGGCEVYLHIVMPDFSRKASRSRRYRVAEDSAVAESLRQRFPGLRAFWGKGAS